jgi:uncharacterized heparinase superfamily protein
MAVLKTAGVPANPKVCPISGTTIGAFSNCLYGHTNCRDVEFVTLVPEEDYQKDWHSWRWLPHVKIRSLNECTVVESELFHCRLRALVDDVS